MSGKSEIGFAKRSNSDPGKISHKSGAGTDPPRSNIEIRHNFGQEQKKRQNSSIFSKNTLKKVKTKELTNTVSSFIPPHSSPRNSGIVPTTNIRSIWIRYC